MVSLESSKSKTVSVDKLTRDVLIRLENAFQSRSLTLDCQLDQVNAKFDQELIDTAITKLVESALATTPIGGEVNVSLVGYKDYWELEVASSIRAKFEKRGNSVHSDSKQIESLSLDLVGNAAEAHGGELRICKNPLGGTAQLIAIPMQPISR